MKNLKKIDKFYLVFTGIMLILAVIVALSFSAVFNAFVVSYEAEQVSTGEEKVDADKLNEAYSFVFNVDSPGEVSAD
jgi:low temperature requirement protein LtrA